MEPTNAMSLPPRELVRVVWSQRKLWMATTAACGLLAAAYSLVMPRYWEAWQGLVVRQETAGATATRPGKFADLYEMRTLQETILEVAKSQPVIIATLQAVDGAAVTPTLEDIEEFRKRLKMLPPDGGEFGKSEVFYFSLRAKSRERAMRLVGELCKQLEIALKDLRGQRAGSLIVELEEQAKLASATLAAETKRLMDFESKVGADLGELRMLHSANSGQSDLRMEAVQLEADLRKFRTQVREGEKLIQLLEAAQKDPRELIATPNTLLTTQPALRRLKDGLVDAQLATSRLGGTRSADHPRVRAAIEAERQIREDLHNELVTAIRGAEVELQLGRDRLAATDERLGDLQRRFASLAEERAEYSNRVAAVDNTRLSLDRARENLSTAKAAQAAAHSGSLVTRLDEPETGPYPAGPGRTVITGAGAMAGLMLGLGLVFLTAGAPRELELVGERPAANYSTRGAAEATADVRRDRTTAASSVTTPTLRDRAESRQFAAQTTTAFVSSATETIPAWSEAAESRVEEPAIRPVANSDESELVDSESESGRPEHELLPVAEGVLPPTPGSLPVGAASGGYGGMSLQDALRAAARQLNN